MSIDFSRWDGEPGKVAIVLPGMGYNPDMPLLYWSAKTLHSMGWTIQRVWWPADLPPRGAERAAAVRQIASDAIDAETGETGEVLLVGKSLGSQAIPCAAERGLRGVWLTPLIAADRPELSETVLPALSKLPPSVLIGGAADPSWDGAVARAGGHTVCEIAGANHSLELDGDPLGSLAILENVVRTVQAYAARS